MSPLARSLLALACAALLHAACAQYNPPYCTTAKKGLLYGEEIKLQPIYVATSLGAEVDYEIPDNCDRLGKGVLHGMTVQACDWNAPPIVYIYDGFKKVHLKRVNYTPVEPPATLQVIQYCKQY